MLPHGEPAPASANPSPSSVRSSRSHCSPAAASPAKGRSMPIGANSRGASRTSPIAAPRCCPARRRWSTGVERGATPSGPADDQHDRDDERGHDEHRRGPASRGSAGTRPNRRARWRRTRSWRTSRRPEPRRRRPGLRRATQVTGDAHCDFVAGPVGPLLNDGCSSPQRPVNASHDSSPVRRTTVGLTSSIGARVSSHPNPLCALLPNQRSDEKYDAWLPSPTNTTGWVSSATLERPAVPVGQFATLVLGVHHLVGLGRPSAACGVGGVEDDLDHLPVALVAIVPVVVDVEEPVLHDEGTGMVGIGDDAAVGERRRPEPVVQLLVRAIRGRARCRGRRCASHRRVRRRRGRRASARRRPRRRVRAGSRPGMANRSSTDIGRYGSPASHSVGWSRTASTGA